MTLQYLGLYGEHEAHPVLALCFSPSDYPFTFDYIIQAWRCILDVSFYTVL